jgi:hypothetical protein
MKRDAAKAAAQAAGLKIYQGNPCVHGHAGIRFTRSGACVDCEREYAKSEKRREVSRRYYQRMQGKSNALRNASSRERRATQSTDQ